MITSWTAQENDCKDDPKSPNQLEYIDPAMSQ